MYYLVILNGAVSKEMPPGLDPKMKAKSMWKMDPS